MKLAEDEEGVPIRRWELDADPWTFNCQNALIDLKTGKARHQRPSDLVSIVAPVDYRPEATCPTWEAFLARIFDANLALIEYVQKLFGMCLTGDVTEQCLHVLYGAGANGKSTLVDTVSAIMGEYAGAAPDSLLTIRGREEHPTEIADLLGKRLVVASETEEGAKLRTQLIKRLTGDRWLKGRFMRQDYFQFRRTHKILLLTNNMPRIDEDSEAVRRRLRVVPFDVIIPAEERDPQLGAKLLAEGSGILNWAIAGCLRWQRDGLKPPGGGRCGFDGVLRG